MANPSTVLRFSFPVSPVPRTLERAGRGRRESFGDATYADSRAARQRPPSRRPPRVTGPRRPVAGGRGPRPMCRRRRRRSPASDASSRRVRRPRRPAVVMASLASSSASATASPASRLRRSHPRTPSRVARVRRRVRRPVDRASVARARVRRGDEADEPCAEVRHLRARDGPRPRRRDRLVPSVRERTTCTFAGGAVASVASVWKWTDTGTANAVPSGANR